MGSITTDLANSSTTSSPGEDWRDEELAFWEISVLEAILAINILGNSLVLLSIYLRHYRATRRRRLTRMHFFVMHLSVADLATGLFNVLPQLVWDISFRFPGGPLTCKLVKYVMPLGSYLSSYILTATAIDRYQAICHPLSYCKTTSRRSRFTVYGAWVIALLLCAPQIHVFSYQEIEPGIWDCWGTFSLTYGERIYVTWFSFTVFLIPFTVLLFTYSAICWSIWRNRENFARGGKNNNNDEKLQNILNHAKNQSALISKAKINTIKQMMTVVLLYVASSAPYMGIQLWASWYPEDAEALSTGPVYTILSLLSSLTSCVNPWIYLTFSYELRESLIKFLRGLIERQNSTSNFDRTPSHMNSVDKSSKKSSLISRWSNQNEAPVAGGPE